MGQKEPEERSTDGEKRRNVSVRDVAHVSPTTLKWAIQRAHTSPEELTSRIKSVKASQIKAWADGDSLPTFSQIETLADKLRVPLAVFFMDEPPKLDVQIPDLRTIGNNQSKTFSLDFIDVLNDALVKQEWCREQLAETNTPRLKFVGKFSSSSQIDAVAADMAMELSINDDLRRDCTNWQAFLSCFVRQAEDLGVLVMRGGIVQQDTSRGLDTKEFRGFAISDDLAPLVYINAKDAKAAQTFTLAHELAHIWIGQSGISNNPERKKTQHSINQIELFCNKVAAELLVPRAGFERIWPQSNDIDTKLQKIASFYRVSRMVAIMRAYELDRIGFAEFSDLMDAEYARFWKQAQEQKEKEGGGNFWSSFSARTGHVLQNAVVNSIRQGTIQYRDAANLLGLKLKTFNKYLKQQVGDR
ncbi:MAG TPA: ImmA/IrrE family metallo-endopeptidase [Candidatus Acidoferrales bacterium]|jgi:Zn-dependent peptidase ImmA (M78 family)|nr:ImmA/IrrE family metallo-endopeptidase [Candidatus Acidoferrales bacterium]